MIFKGNLEITCRKSKINKNVPRLEWLDARKRYVKKGDTFVFPQGSAHWWVNYSPTEQLATVGGFTAPFPDAAPLADFLDESKKVNNLLTDAVLGQNYRSAIELQEMNGADTLFPLLSTRYPSTCVANTPCQKCNWSSPSSSILITTGLLW